MGQTPLQVQNSKTEHEIVDPRCKGIEGRLESVSNVVCSRELESLEGEPVLRPFAAFTVAGLRCKILVSYVP